MVISFATGCRQGLNEMSSEVFVLIEFCMRPSRFSSAGWEREPVTAPSLSPLEAVEQLQSFLLTALGPSGEGQRERRCHCIPLSTALAGTEREGRGKGRCPLQGQEAELWRKRRVKAHRLEVFKDSRALNTHTHGADNAIGAV